MVFAINDCNMFDICRFIYMSHGRKKKMTPKSRDFWPMAIKTQDLVGVARGDHNMKNVVTMRKHYMIIGVLHVH